MELCKCERWQYASHNHQQGGRFWKIDLEMVENDDSLRKTATSSITSFCFMTFQPLHRWILLFQITIPEWVFGKFLFMNLIKLFLFHQIYFSLVCLPNSLYLRLVYYFRSRHLLVSALKSNCTPVWYEYPVQLVLN